MFQRTDFIVYETPYSIFGNDLTELNLTFLKNYNSDYYYKLFLEFEKIDFNEHNNSTLIRLLYCHALESLFSLMIAVVQAPHFIIGWLQKYQISELKSIINKLINNNSIYSKFETPISSIEQISKYCNIYFNENIRENMIVEYSKLWNNLAIEFIDNDLAYEYNSLKHGLRFIPGGFNISFGKENTYGISPPLEQMKSLGGSKFGSKIWLLNEIKNKNSSLAKSFVIIEKSVNWNPEFMLKKICLISFSISNLISFARILNGENPNTIKFSNPKDIDAFKLVHDDNVRIKKFSIHPNYDDNFINENLTTKKNVIRNYSI